MGTRATRVAKDEAPHRGSRRARPRFLAAQLRRGEALVCAEALDRHLRPTVGYAGMPRGTPPEGMPPGPHAQHSGAGALERSTGSGRQGLGPHHTQALRRDLLGHLEARYPAAP